MRAWTPRSVTWTSESEPRGDVSSPDAAADPHRVQRRAAGPRRVRHGKANTGEHRAVAARAQRDALRGRAARERRPEAVVALAEAREDRRLDAIRHRRDDGDERVDVHVLHRERAESRALDEQPAERVDDRRLVPRRAEGDRRIAAQRAGRRRRGCAVSATTAYVTCGWSRASSVQVVDSEIVSRTANFASGTSLTCRSTSAPRTGLVNVTAERTGRAELASPGNRGSRCGGRRTCRMASASRCAAPRPRLRWARRARRRSRAGARLRARAARRAAASRASDRAASRRLRESRSCRRRGCGAASSRAA